MIRVVSSSGSVGFEAKPDTKFPHRAFQVIRPWRGVPKLARSEAGPQDSVALLLAGEPSQLGKRVWEELADAGPLLRDGSNQTTIQSEW